MEGAVVNSILARSLLDAAFLEQLMQDAPTALKDYALSEKERKDFLALDIIQVSNFAGFITKVQHNYLWESFPYTLTLLRYYKMEIKVFSAYLDTHLKLKTEGATRNRKIESFLTFLQSYLVSHSDARCPGLREVLIHERMQWEIRNFLSNSGTSGPELRAIPTDLSSLNSRQFARLTPLVRGALRGGVFTYDPFRIIADLNQGQFDPNALLDSPRYICYWGDSITQQLRVVELDNLSALLISEVDGRRSVRTIISRVMKHLSGKIRPSEFRPFFETAFEQGLLSPGS